MTSPMPPPKSAPKPAPPNRAEALAKTALAKIRSTARADAVFAIRACALVTVRAEVRDRPYTAANSLARAPPIPSPAPMLPPSPRKPLARPMPKKPLPRPSVPMRASPIPSSPKKPFADTAALADSVVAKARVFARNAFKARYEDPVVHRMMSAAPYPQSTIGPPKPASPAPSPRDIATLKFTNPKLPASPSETPTISPKLHVGGPDG